MNLEEVSKRPPTAHMGVVFYPVMTADEYQANWHSPFCPVAEARNLLDLGMAVRGIRALTLLVSQMRGVSEGEVIGLLVKEAFEHPPKGGVFIGMSDEKAPTGRAVPPPDPGSRG